MSKKLNNPLYYITEEGIKTSTNNSIFLAEEKGILEILKRNKEPLSVYKIQLLLLKEFNIEKHWNTINMRIEDLVKDKLVGVRKR